MSANIQKPLLNAFLQGDLRGNGKQIINAVLSEASLADALDGNAQLITDLGGLVVGYNDTKEIWIGQRTSGKAGSGSKIDPFDGSTAAKLDEIIQSRYADNETNVIFMFHDGDYSTYGSKSYNDDVDAVRGYHGYYLRPSWKFISNGGPSNCKITLNRAPVEWPAGTARAVIFESDIYNNQGDDILVEGFTFDANWPEIYGIIGQTNKAIDCVHIHGTRAKIRNCVVVNAYGNEASLMESFAFGIGPSIVDSVIQPIYDCEMEYIFADGDEYQGDYGGIGGISAGGGADGEVPAYFGGLAVRKCHIRNWNTFASKIGCDGVLEDCVFENVGNAFRLDTVNSERVRYIIRRNQFLNIPAGRSGCEFTPALSSGEGSIYNAEITDNLFEMRNGAGGISLAGANGFLCYDTLVARNRFYKSRAAWTSEETEVATAPLAMYFAGTQRLQLRDNFNPENLRVWFDDPNAIGPNVGVTFSDTSLDSYAPTIGCLSHSVTLTDTDGYSQYFIQPDEYTIQEGDQLVIEMMAGPENTEFRSRLTVQSDSETFADLVDQNGVPLNSTTLNRAYSTGKFYRRVISLADFVGDSIYRVGTTIDGFTGAASYFFRHIFVMDEDGREALAIFHDYMTAMPLVGPSSVPFHAEESSFRIVSPVPSDAYAPPPSGIELVSADVETDGVTLTLVFSDAVEAGADGFNIWALARIPYDLYPTYASGTGTNTLTLTLAETILTDEEDITLTYAQPGDGVQDTSNNLLASFMLFPVTNGSSQT